MAHVFISYAHVDENFVGSLKQELNKAGFLTWTDEDISPGEHWSKAIDEAIKDSFVLIVIMTEAARKSEYVTYEWSFALGCEIPVIPFLLEKTDLHPKLGEIQYIDYTKKIYGGQNSALSKLTTRLRILTENPKPKPNAIINTSEHDLTNLFNDLNGEDGDKRKTAATVLGDFKDVRATPYLVKALDDVKPSVRAEAAYALGEIGDKKCLADLLSALRNSKAKDVRANLIIALGKIGDDKAIPTLTEIARFTRESREQELIIKALKKIGTNSVKGALAKIAHDRYSAIHVRKLAIEALGIANDEDAASNLYSLLNDQNLDIQIAAVNALETIGTQKALYYSDEWHKKRKQDKQEE